MIAPAPTVPAPGTTQSITSLSRDAGSTTGGTTLLVNGSNLSAGTEVLFDGQRASSVTAISATQLRVQTPARAGAGPVAVIVRNGTSADTLANAFEYVPAPTKTFVSHGFEDGSRGRFGFWQTTVTTEAAR